jgi:recombination protein RecT
MENKKEEPKKDAGGLFDAPTKQESMANPNGMKKPEEQPTQEKPKEETGVAVNQPSKHSLAPVNNESKASMDNIRKTVKGLLQSDAIKKRFEEILSKDANGFMANLSVMVSNSAMLSKCEPVSVVSCAILAASLNLSLDPSLGEAALIPFGDKCTFQVMTLGWVKLALNTDDYKIITANTVYEGELVQEDRFTDTYIFDSKQRKSNKVIGYQAYFKMKDKQYQDGTIVEGYSKMLYWDVETVKAHGAKYSQMFKRGQGLWVTDFDKMAQKTVLKFLIRKWGAKSITMQKAITFDQSLPSSTDDDANPIYTDAIEVGNVEEANEKMKAIIEAGTEGENENNQK